MNFPSSFRFNLITLVLCAFVLNVAIVLASSASTAAFEQAQPRLSDTGEAAEEEVSYYRQPMAFTQERFARNSASGNKIPFYPSYRFGSVRLITPYALQHLLSSRFQNADYPGCNCEDSARVAGAVAKRAKVRARIAVPRIGKSDRSAVDDADQFFGKMASTGATDGSIDSLMEKVKKFHSGQLYGMKNLPFNNFMYYTKGNEFLGGPGKR